MPADSFPSTREAEALYLMGKYDKALASLDRAIASTAVVLTQSRSDQPFTLEATDLDPLEPGRKIPQVLRQKFEQEAGITLETGKNITVSTLSAPNEINVWLIVSQEDRSEQKYLLIKQETRQGEANVAVYQPTSACARVFAHRGETYFQRGMAILRKNPYQQGQDSFNQNVNTALQNLDLALNLKPNYAWASAKKGEIYRVKGNQYKPMTERQADYEVALACFDEAIKLNPDYAWALAHRSATICNARRADRYQEALDNLIKANQLMGGEYAWAVAYQGAIHLQRVMDGQGDPAEEYDLSIVDLMTAIMMDNRMLERAAEPGQRFRDIYLGFAALLFKVKRYYEAIRFCNQALERNPKNGLNYARALYYRALSYEALKSKDQLEQYFFASTDFSRWEPQAAYLALAEVAKKLLGTVRLEGAEALTRKEEKELTALSHDDKEAIEEILTMMFGMEAILSPDTPPTNLSRMLAIFKALFPEQHFDAERAAKWFQSGYAEHISKVLDQVMWKDRHLVEAISDAMSKPEPRSNPNV